MEILKKICSSKIYVNIIYQSGISADLQTVPLVVIQGVARNVSHLTERSWAQVYSNVDMSTL